MTNNPRDDLMALADRLRVRLGESRTVTIDRTLYFDLQEVEKALRLAASRLATQQTTSRIGAWLAAALDDPKVCAEMKADIEAWMNAGEPPYLPAPVDREAVARALCESGKFETGEGTCALLCMDQLGSVRKKGCNHLTRVHGKLVDSILSLIRPAEPVEAKQRDTWNASKHDEIIKRLMEQVGMPNSRSLYQAFKQFANELHHMDLGASATAPQPTTPDAVVEPVAWRARRLEWIERIGVDGTFDASTSIGHYIATITDDGRGMWFVVGLTTSNYIDGDISAVQFAAQSDYENRIRSAIEVAPHPPASPDTSAAVLQSHALKQALDCLSEIAGAHIPDCPAHYAGEELAWAQRHVGCLRQKAEIARDGIAAAIRQLPTSERGDK